jgi:uncharacterized protein (DUF58 family)
MTKGIHPLTLFGAPVAAAVFMSAARDHDRVLAATWPVLIILWFVTMIAIAARALQAIRARRLDPTMSSSWVRCEILTGAGRSLMWASTGAIVIAAITGWASVSVLGVLGFASVYLAILWTALVAGGEAAWRGATIERALLPESPQAGDPVRERVKLSGVKIPAGMRLFATARPLRHGAATRYCIGAEASGAEVELESELGPAPRGVHEVPPLAMWLGDVFGLARGPVVQRAPTRLTVLPRSCPVDGADELLGAAGDAERSQPTQIMPTEGTFRIRDYASGDDTRRIHWMRSLQVNRLVVRLPDEIPIAQTEVRVVLDDHLWGAEWLSCLGADQLLDAVVRVWLGLGKSLADTGARVTMVAAVPGERGIVAVERPMNPRAPREAQRLGARVRWQGTTPVSALVDKSSVRHVIVTSRPHRFDTSAEVTWVVVPDAYWTTNEPEWRVPSAMTLTHPIGSGDNRLVRRRAERTQLQIMWRDRAVLTDMLWLGRSAPAGAYVARLAKGRIALEVAS